MNQDLSATRRPGLSAWFVPIGLVIACFIAFGSSITGEFVYDDSRQIVVNPLIKEINRIPEALSSDVWAFREASGAPGSNYWRPTFTFWHVINYQAFGVDNTRGWHISNIALHALVTLLAFGLLRYLGLSRAVAGFIALIHAVHPVRTESVAWISGSPDLLMAATFLGALWLALEASRTGNRIRHVFALMLLALSLGAKEVAIVFPALLFATLVLTEKSGKPGMMSRLLWAAGICIPYALLAVVYFLVRLSIVGEFTLDDATDVSLAGLAVTAPELFTFYLRQVFVPLWLSPAYSIAAIEPSSISFANFWLPAAVSALVLAALAWFSRKGVIQAVGALIFLLALMPAFNINAFISDHLVHDRYLYLPLLGLLMVLVPTLASVSDRILAGAGSARVALGYGLGGLCCLFLAFKSFDYSRAWRTELSLWEHATVSQPGAAFNWFMLGDALAGAGRDQEAMTALNRALEKPAGSTTPWALISRADIHMREGELREAAEDLNLVIKGSPGNVLAYEQLAVVYQRAGSLQDAARVLIRGRQANPHHDCEFSVNLAVLQYLGGLRDEALAGLEQNRVSFENKPTPGCRLGLFRLGQLYMENGQEEEGRALIGQYLTMTAAFDDEVSLRYRESARAILSR